MEDKIINSSQIKSTKSETILTEFQFDSLDNFIYGFVKNLISSILNAEDKPAKLAEQGKDFTNEVGGKAERATNVIAPQYIGRLQELKFLEKNIPLEVYKKEIKKLLKKEGFLK